MRIIAGIYKGKFVAMPKGIRPTQDKVRKALFDILGDITGLSFLELYAGSGAVGFEALSRGIRELILVERNSGSLEAIKANIEAFKPKSCHLLAQSAQNAVKRLHELKKEFDIIFLDPPYYLEESKKTLQMLEAYDILSPDGLIIIQHFKKDILPEALGDLTLLRQSRYGDTLLSFYRREDKGI
jgi:16S rRNA (guanine(966)-N(2))-methyltransferase RsmD